MSSVGAMAGFLLVNPRSGRPRPTAGDLVHAARRRGIGTHVLCEGEDPAELARRAAAEPLAVAGGDGSLAPAAAVAIEPDVPFVCIPFGTRSWSIAASITGGDERRGRVFVAGSPCQHTAGRSRSRSTACPRRRNSSSSATTSMSWICPRSAPATGSTRGSWLSTSSTAQSTRGRPPLRARHARGAARCCHRRRAGGPHDADQVAGRAVRSTAAGAAMRLGRRL
jgi:hypothetical protein